MWTTWITSIFKGTFDEPNIWTNKNTVGAFVVPVLFSFPKRTCWCVVFRCEGRTRRLARATGARFALPVDVALR